MVGVGLVPLGSFPIPTNRGGQQAVEAPALLTVPPIPFPHLSKSVRFVETGVGCAAQPSLPTPTLSS